MGGVPPYNIESTEEWFTNPENLYIGQANRTHGVKASKWMNPWTIEDCGSREECLQRYEEYVRNDQLKMESIDEIEGKQLGCYCAPRDCHANVLLKILSEKKGDNTLVSADNNHSKAGPLASEKQKHNIHMGENHDNSTAEKHTAENRNRHTGENHDRYTGENHNVRNEKRNIHTNENNNMRPAPRYATISSRNAHANTHTATSDPPPSNWERQNQGTGQAKQRHHGT